MLWERWKYRASFTLGIWVCKLQDRREITLKLQKIRDWKFWFGSKAIMVFGELHLMNLNNKGGGEFIMLFQGLDIFVWKDIGFILLSPNLGAIHKQDDLWYTSFTTHFHTDWEQCPKKIPSRSQNSKYKDPRGLL